MARNQVRMLEGGDALPELALKFVDGKQAAAQDVMRGKWAALLVYRGGW